MSTTRIKGGDFMFSKLDARMGAKNNKLNVPKRDEPLDIDGAERFLEDAAGAGKKLAEGLRKAATALDDIANSGLTHEALLVLVTAKCGSDRHGNATTTEKVRLVLEGLFRLDEYLR